MSQSFLLVLLVLSGSVPSLSAAPHLGPVSDIQVVGQKVFSVSQAGVFEGIGAPMQLVARPSIRVTSLFVGPQGTALLFAGGDPGRSGSFGVLDRATDEAPDVHEVAKDLVYDLAVGSAGIALACADGTVLSLPPGAFNARWIPVHRHTAPARAVAFSPDGKWLASVGLDGVVMISAAEPAPGEAPLQLLDHSAGVESVVWSPDSTLLASGSRDSKVRLHEVGGTLVRTYKGLGMEDEPVAGRLPARVLALAWNGTNLLAGTSNGALYRLSLTDDTTHKLARPSHDPIYSLAFGPERGGLLGTESRLEEFEFSP